jgi:hypothetical protein
MNDRLLTKTFAALPGIFIGSTVLAQDGLRGTLTMGLGDLAQIKQKAESGDAAAQVALQNAIAQLDVCLRLGNFLGRVM